MTTSPLLPLLRAGGWAGILLLFGACAKNPADDVAKAEEASGEVETVDGPGTVYRFTADSSIGFVGSKVTGRHEGGFKEFSGTFKTDGKRLLGTANRIEIAMKSTWSDAEKLTGHLMSADFFDVETYPTSVFELLRVTKAEGENRYTLVGKLTLHGVTKQISFPATVTRGANGHPALDAEFAINRKDYGIVYPGMPDDLIRDEVVIRLAMRSEPVS
jgi:polyisoprenoid-binding protein YceI